MNPKYYEERLQRDLDRIKNAVAEIAVQIEKNLHQAVSSILNMDRRLAYRVILSDHVINRSIQDIDRMCHRFVARHLPSAGHLRFISSVLRMNIGLERMGDYAVTICRKMVQLTQPFAGRLRAELECMSEDAFKMLHQAMQAFNDTNPELAQETMGFAKIVERTLAGALQALIDESTRFEKPMPDLFGIMVIFNALERVSDQSKNICEETVFVVTGEMKGPKVFRILFLDDQNGVRSRMANAIASKVFPDSGLFTCAGRQETQRMDPFFEALMEDLGFEKNRGLCRPPVSEWMPQEWRGYHVVVSLDGPIDRYLKQVPYYTVALEWEIPTPPSEDTDEDVKKQRYEEIYMELSHHIQELMEILRGEEAT